MATFDVRATIAQREAELASVRENITQTSELLRGMRAREAAITEELIALRHEQNSVARIETKQKVDTLQDEVQKRDAKLRQLQAAMEAAMAERDDIQTELHRVIATSDSAAGVKQATLQSSVARYEPARTRTNDPLSQSQGHTTDRFPQGPAQSPARGSGAFTDSLGKQATASPLVKPEEFVVQGSRPEAPQSAKFSDWRPKSRISQPPGGRSSNIFG